VNDGFFERTGVSWSLSGPNWFARFGGGAAAPPFGGAQPGAGIGGGVGVAGGGINGGLTFMAGQGSRRSNVSQSGNLTLYNGYPGFLSDTSQTPFVTGLIPVVGQGKPPWRQQLDGDIPTQRRDPSPAANEPVEAAPAVRGDDSGLRSVAEIEQQRAAAQSAKEQEVHQYLAKAREARQAGKANVAKIYYRMAAQRAAGTLKNRIAAELEAIDAEGRAP
jgi:hypothetical protein